MWVASGFRFFSLGSWDLSFPVTSWVQGLRSAGSEGGSVADPDHVYEEITSLKQKPWNQLSMLWELIHRERVVGPSHEKQGSGLGTMPKRRKKVQIGTLKTVYICTKQPATNEMMSSIVHVANLPWKRVVKWFEDEWGENRISHHRLPYQRLTPEIIFSFIDELLKPWLPVNRYRRIAQPASHYWPKQN